MTPKGSEKLITPRSNTRKPIEFKNANTNPPLILDPEIRDEYL
jgi:hypothetical protein